MNRVRFLGVRRRALGRMADAGSSMGQDAGEPGRSRRAGLAAGRRGRGPVARRAARSPHFRGKGSGRSRKARCTRHFCRRARTGIPSAPKRPRRRPSTERPGIDPPSTSAEWIEGYWEWDAGRNDFVWVTGTWRDRRLPGDSGSTATGSATTRAGIGSPASGASGRPIGSITARTVPLRTAPTTNPAIPPIPIVFMSPASIIRTATASSGKKATGRRRSQAGRGSPPSGFASPTAGCFKKATGIASLEDRGILFTPAEVDKSAARSRRSDLSTVHARFHPRCTGS